MASRYFLVTWAIVFVIAAVRFSMAGSSFPVLPLMSIAESAGMDLKDPVGRAWR